MLSKNVVCGLGAAALVAVMAPARANAQTVDQRVYFTFSGPVELPGVGLPPGKYLFHLAEPTAARDVVQVASADGRKVYGTFFTKSVDRFDAASKPEVRFMEVAAGAPPAISTYWLPGDRAGKEFVYPKQQARRLAKFAKHAVLTTKAETAKTDETRTSDLVRVSSNGSEAAYAPPPPPTEPLTGQSQAGEYAADSGAASIPAPQDQVARATLPQTASAMPWAGFIGMLCVGLAIGIRVWHAYSV